MSNAILRHTLNRKALSVIIPVVTSPIRKMGAAR